MVIIGLKGGLGNQMFQYAAGRRLAHTTNQELKLDVDFFERKNNYGKVTVRKYELSAFNIIENFASKSEKKKLRNTLTRGISKIFPSWSSNPFIQEKNFHFDASVMDMVGEHYLEGHWMSEKYFLDIIHIIHQEFKFKEEILFHGRDLLSRIRNSNSVCIQIRRGDYITNAQIAKLHQTTSLSYFQQGAELINRKVESPVFFIFSDDPDWCKLNLKTIKNANFVENELTNATTQDYLQLMISCKHFIISNSTFAWWAAWLSLSPDKIVIAPTKWFNDERILTSDIYPASWITI